MPSRTFTPKVAMNRQVAGTVIAIAGLNALFGLIHTLEPTSGWPLLTTVLHWSVVAQLGILAGAVALAQEDRLVAGTIVASTIFPTQAHVLFVRPQMLGWTGWPILAVAALTIGVFVHLHWLKGQRTTQSHAVTVTDMTLRRRDPNRIPAQHRSAA